LIHLIHRQKHVLCCRRSSTEARQDRGQILGKGQGEGCPHIQLPCRQGYDFIPSLIPLRGVGLPLTIASPPLPSTRSAVSDAVRTSLGPKGMDKMVRFSISVAIQIAGVHGSYSYVVISSDPNPEQGGDYHKRWCHHSRQARAGPSGREDGTNFFIQLFALDHSVCTL
jgi:hypothetical protein